MSEQKYKSDFRPCIEIGWRLSKNIEIKDTQLKEQKDVLEYAFRELEIKNIKSIYPTVNINSENVMKKIGMKKVKEFNHLLLKDLKSVCSMKLKILL